MITHLLKKEFSLELKRKSVIAGLSLYLLSMVFICYLAFALRQSLITPLVWDALFWITILFTAINTVAKSFIGEKKGLDIYTYSIASPVAVLFSKIIYNFILCFVLTLAGYFLFTVFLNDPVKDKSIFFIVIISTSLGFAAALTLLSGLSAKASNSNILMAVLSFPVVISILLIAVQVTKNCMDALDPSVSYQKILSIVAIDAMVTAASYLLFPFIWKN